jgi:hypothetical protein
MNELAHLVAQAAEIPPDKAAIAVGFVLRYLKEKLPASVASELDRVQDHDESQSGRRGGWNS